MNRCYSSLLFEFDFFLMALAFFKYHKIAIIRPANSWSTRLGFVVSGLLCSYFSAAKCVQKPQSRRKTKYLLDLMALFFWILYFIAVSINFKQHIRKWCTVLVMHSYLIVTCIKMRSWGLRLHVPRCGVRVWGWLINTSKWNKQSGAVSSKSMVKSTSKAR